MKIGGFQLPKINLGNLGNLGGVGGSVLNGIKDTLKNVVGEFFKSGFEGAKKSLLETVAKQLGISLPPQLLGSKTPGVPSNGNTGIVGPGTSTGSTGGIAGSFKAPSDAGSDAKSRIEHELGKEATAGWDSMPQAAKDDLARQAALQKASRTTQMMTNILQALHEMNKSIIQNFRA